MQFTIHDHVCVNNVYLCPMQTFKEAVITRLRSCVDEDVFIPLYPKKSVYLAMPLNLYIYIYTLRTHLNDKPC